MPSRAPLTDEEMQALRDRMDRYEAAKSNRAPAQAPSQTFGMSTHSSRNVGRRPRYDPEALASERYHHNLELMDLRKKVEADNEERAAAKRVKVQAVKDDQPEGGYPAFSRPTMSSVYGMSYRDSGVPEERRAYWKERGIDSPGLSPEERANVQGPTAKVQLPVGDRPISSMYSVTPNQYRDTYGVPFTGSDPDSMRRLLALQNGTASVIGSERKVMDQQSQDAFDNRPANPNPPAFGGLAPITPEQQLAQKRGVADRAKTDFEMQTGGLLFDKAFEEMQYTNQPLPGESIRYMPEGQFRASRKERERVEKKGDSSPPRTSAVTIR